MIWVYATAYGFMLHDMGLCYSIWVYATAYGYLLQHMGLVAQHMGIDPLSKYLQDDIDRERESPIRQAFMPNLHAEAKFGQAQDAVFGQESTSCTLPCVCSYLYLH